MEAGRQWREAIAKAVSSKGVLTMRRFPVALVLLCAAALAQEFRGTILGRITDPSGAVIFQAKRSRP